MPIIYLIMQVPEFETPDESKQNDVNSEQYMV